MSREGHWEEIPSLVRAHDCKRQVVGLSVVLREEKDPAGKMVGSTKQAQSRAGFDLYEKGAKMGAGSSMHGKLQREEELMA